MLRLKHGRRIATLLAALNGTATHPLTAHLDDDAMRHELRFIAHQLLPLS